MLEQVCYMQVTNITRKPFVQLTYATKKEPIEADTRGEGFLGISLSPQDNDLSFKQESHCWGQEELLCFGVKGCAVRFTAALMQGFFIVL
jgi:hypothetical protein